mgnify:CR=1 FL=1
MQYLVCNNKGEILRSGAFSNPRDSIYKYSPALGELYVPLDAGQNVSAKRHFVRDGEIEEKGEFLNEFNSPAIMITIRYPESKALQIRPV